MTRKKKIFIGAGVVVLLALIAFVNFRFKKVSGVEVTTEAIEKRDLQSIVSDNLASDAATAAHGEKVAA